ncbi:MAG TPA: exopolysaccharide biosynthesis protein [Gammaproteobacteria bacterium]|nr:exopolysaccharide biosynthesis protein [Gammaproteobacteria bacterium]
MAQSARAAKEPKNLEQLLDKLGQAPDEADEKVTVDDILKAVGRRSFGPLLLVTGLLAASPISAIPGMPTTLGVLVALIAVQMLLRRDRFWLPQWIVRRKVSREKFCKGLGWMRKPALFIDRFLRPRLEVVTNQGGLYTIALLCSLIGVAMPSLEIVPFSAHIAGLALTAFGLSLIAHDGLVGLIALSITAGAVAFVVVTVLL